MSKMIPKYCVGYTSVKGVWGIMFLAGEVNAVCKIQS